MRRDSQFLSSMNGATELPLAPAFSVSEINGMVADVLSANLPGLLSVEGEISNLSVAASGHRYFSLKDAHSTISCALFRGAARRISREILSDLNNGDKVVVKANLSVYQPRGDYQLIVNDVEPAGFGGLAKAFAALKHKLDAAGYTASERKRAIPTWPASIAVVTSATGAAVRDVLTTLARRAPFIPVTVYPTLVQGNEAPMHIVKALQAANQDDSASVIVLVRGGGSLEDLQAFNDEQVAMAVVNSRLPVVSGVGHETDFTIIDFVSDTRAPTPTAAAEWVSPDQQHLRQALHRQRQRLLVAINTRRETRQQHWRTLQYRLLLLHPQKSVLQNSQRLDEISMRLQRLMLARLSDGNRQLLQARRQLMAFSPQQKRQQSQQQLVHYRARLQQLLQQRKAAENQRLQVQKARLLSYSQHVAQQHQLLKGLHTRLALLSPLGVLSRGYALTFDPQGHLLKKSCDVEVGDILRVKLAQGELLVKVEASLPASTKMLQ